MLDRLSLGCTWDQLASSGTALGSAAMRGLAQTLGQTNGP